MKQIKRIVLLLMAGSLVLSLVGCGNKNDEASVKESETIVESEATSASGESEVVSSEEAEQETTVEETVSSEEEEMTALLLVEKMAEASEGKQILKVTTSMDMVMSMVSQGVTVEMAMTSKGDTLASLEPYASYANTEMTIDMYGQQVTEASQMYIFEEDGVMVSYIYSDSTGQWQKLDTGMSADEMRTQYTEDVDWMMEIPMDGVMLEPESQMVGDREAYVLSRTFTGQEMQQALQKTLGGMSDLQDLLSESGLEALNYSSLNVPTVYYIDTETYLPIRIEMEIEGMGEMMNNLMTDMSGETTESTDMEMEIDISKVHVVYTNISYEPVAVPALPEEVVLLMEQAAFNPDQGDGTYIIQESGVAVKVACPEGWTVTEMTYDSLTLESNDNQLAVYMMYKDANSTDFMTVVEQVHVPDMQAEGIYISHGMGPVIGVFETMEIKCTGANLFYAWAPMGEGWVFVQMADFNDLSMEDVVTPLLEVVEVWELP